MPDRHVARRRFGQNFLHDGGVIDRIVAAVAPLPGERLVEIGPGQGALTGPLLDAAGTLEVIELDRDLVARLADRFRHRPELVIHSADALRFDFAGLAAGDRLRLVGNLPYNISTPLLFHLFAQGAAVADMHFMLQREVVTRLAADPGSKSYGRLSVMAQCRCRVTPLFDVAAAAFRPQPKVTSTVVRLEPHATPLLEAALLGALDTVVATAFSQRRKTLRNALRTLFETAALDDAGIDPGRRAETLSLAEYIRLAKRL